jgi:hypothetical protein
VTKNIEEYIPYFHKDFLKNEFAFIKDDYQPKSGDIFLVDSSVCVSWRKDNHQYSWRDHPFKTNEDKKCLVLNKKKVIWCKYSRGYGPDPSNNDKCITPKSLKRRAYLLMNSRKFVFVHYLDDDRILNVKKDVIKSFKNLNPYFQKIKFDDKMTSNGYLKIYFNLVVKCKSNFL